MHFLVCSILFFILFSRFKKWAYHFPENLYVIASNWLFVWLMLAVGVWFLARILFGEPILMTE